MNLKLPITLIFCSACLVLFTTCKQTEPPCAGAKEPTAAFTMMETEPVFNFNFTTYDTDTALGGWIQFTALESNAKYEWKIGTDTTIYKNQQFMLNFNPYYIQNEPNVPPVSVTLKVTKTPGSCFPESDSIKYLTRTLYLTNKWILDGTFKGHFNYETIERVLRITMDTTENLNRGSLIIGLPNKDTLFISDDLEAQIFFYRKAIFNFDNSTSPPLDHLLKAEMMVTPNNKNIFIWIKQNNPKLPSTYTFTGTRIH